MGIYNIKPLPPIYTKTLAFYFSPGAQLFESRLQDCDINSTCMQSEIKVIIISHIYTLKKPQIKFIQTNHNIYILRRNHQIKFIQINDIFNILKRNHQIDSEAFSPLFLNLKILSSILFHSGLNVIVVSGIGVINDLSDHSDNLGQLPSHVMSQLVGLSGATAV